MSLNVILECVFLAMDLTLDSSISSGFPGNDLEHLHMVDLT